MFYDNAREMLLDEMLDKANLLDKAGRERGLEDPTVIKLYKLYESGASYIEMSMYYRATK